MAIKIILDAGHGGSDPGAVYEDRQEKVDVLALTLALGEKLESMGYDVEFTRTDDTYDSPVKKARLGNESGADYFISIHRNSSSEPNRYNGVQTLVYNDEGVKAQLGKNINAELEKVGFRNINVEERPDLAVLRRTSMPAVLLEIGFINSDIDNSLFDQRFDEIVDAIAKGIDETLVTSVFSDTQSDNENSCDGLCHGRGYQILLGIYRGYSTAVCQMNYIVKEGFEAEIYEDEGLYQVRLGNYEDMNEAVTVQKRLKDKGYSTLIVNSY